MLSAHDGMKLGTNEEPQKLYKHMETKQYTLNDQWTTEEIKGDF
jgi:hypothetical protein